ncbi:MAG: virulence RhuM family protein [Muribaculaceae bacterium]|nr:virulence RhuM family protein [Muribaculaceae bacterium]
MEKNRANEIILYQPDDTLTLDVRVEDESVWLTQAQMAELFQTTRNNITLHTRNIFKEGELVEQSVSKESLLTAKDGKRYRTKFYNLDVIISVGYRVKSLRGTQFRIWALKIIKDYLLRGYSVNQRLMLLEDKIDRRFSEYDQHFRELDGKVDFFVRSSLQPKEGVFFNGQIFDAYALVADLIRGAKERIVLIDNYIDDTVLVQLAKRKPGVTVDIYDGHITKQLRQDVEKHNEQYPGVTLHKYTKAHDRFLIIDEDVYHIGASLKDLGKKLFAFSKMEVMTGMELLTGM